MLLAHPGGLGPEWEAHVMPRQKNETETVNECKQIGKQLFSEVA
jgi:hypothetical protein